MRLAATVASFLRQLSLFDPPEPAAAERLRGPVTPALPELPVAAGHPAFADLLRGPYARIEVVPKPRLHESWRVTWIRRREALRLEIPAVLAEASESVKLALLEWSLLVSRGRRKDPALRARRSELERSIRAALRGPDSPASGAARRRALRDGRRLERLRPRGAHHDLDTVLRAINARYFDGKLEARITWSARLGGLSTHTIAHDGEGKPYHLLTISRGYDDPEVTPEILGGVVYHECLHIAIPPRHAGGRRVVHGSDFRRLEREYDHYEVWRKWHREGLPKALRRLNRRGR